MQSLRHCKYLTGIFLLAAFLLCERVGGHFVSALTLAEEEVFAETAPEPAISGGTCTAIRPCKENAGLLVESLFTGAPQFVRLLPQ